MKTLHFYIDEAGRGPLAGPLSVGIIFPLQKLKKSDLDGFRDSKKLSESQREVLFSQVLQMERQDLLRQTVSYASVVEIDKYGMTNAQFLAIIRGISALLDNLSLDKNNLNMTLTIDGNRDFGLKKAYPDWTIETIIKGDDKIKEISMASILAKVSRDNLMKALPAKYTKYGFTKHKGYGTKDHLDAITTFGPSNIHRKLFLKRLFPDHKIQKTLPKKLTKFL
ncbi:ribonuclease HII [candidate division SR1 bacterium]|nr:ribonuclease HII [candidate division SR1 bacterium]